jgi:alanine dehydrogenase
VAWYVGPRDLERLFEAKLVTPAECVAAVAASFREQGEGHVGLVPRQILTADGQAPTPRSRALKLSASYMRDSRTMGASLYSTHFRPGEVDMWIALFSGETGRMHGILSGKALTLWKTGATAAVAEQQLARANAQRVALIGTGRYARTQLLCLAAVRDLREVACYSRDGAKLEAFVAWAADALPQAHVRAAADARDAVADADIVTTITVSPTPVVRGEWLAPGTHVNAMGQHAPGTRELDTEAIVRARVFVDAREQAFAEKGELLLPMAEGAIDAAHVVADLGEVVAGRVAGRRDAQEITVFCSGGTALEYMGLCALLVERARAAGCGQRLDE